MRIYLENKLTIKQKFCISWYKGLLSRNGHVFTGKALQTQLNILKHILEKIVIEEVSSSAAVQRRGFI
jgi:hypothetical protein